MRHLDGVFLVLGVEKIRINPASESPETWMSFCLVRRSHDLWQANIDKRTPRCSEDKRISVFKRCSFALIKLCQSLLFPARNLQAIKCFLDAVLDLEMRLTHAIPFLILTEGFRSISCFQSGIVPFLLAFEAVLTLSANIGSRELPRLVPFVVYGHLLIADDVCFCRFESDIFWTEWYEYQHEDLHENI